MPPLGVLIGTGPMQLSQVSGAAISGPVSSFSYFSGAVSGVGVAYVSGTSGDPSILDFGFMLSELFIMNNGNTDLAFQWKERWGQNVDSGLVPAGETYVMRRCLKSGMKIRCADQAGLASCVVWGV